MNIFALLWNIYVQGSVFFQMVMEIHPEQPPYLAEANGRCSVGSWSLGEKLPYSKILSDFHILTQIGPLNAELNLALLDKVEVQVDVALLKDDIVDRVVIFLDQVDEVSKKGLDFRRAMTHGFKQWDGLEELSLRFEVELVSEFVRKHRVYGLLDFIVVVIHPNLVQVTANLLLRVTRYL